jgi:hypothetical protein
MKKIFAAMTAALMMVALVSSVAVAKAPANNLLKNVAYYTVNNGSTFCRWATPQKSVALTPTGTASQRQSGNGVSLSITGATAYADNGFYVPLGTLSTLAGYTVLATGSSFSTNLWFDTSTANDTSANGNFFSWNGGSPDCFSAYDGDISGLGQPSTATGTGQSVTVNDSSTFTLTCSGVYQTVTFAQLKAGFCSGISSATPVAVWIGITAARGGSLSTTITSATTN